MAVDLGIQDIGQFWDSNQTSISNEACGLACLKACMVWLKIGKAPALNQMIRESQLPAGSKGLTCQEVADNGLTRGVDCRVEVLSLDQLKAHLDAKRPVIVELSYADVPRSWVQDKAFLGYHFETVSGYTDDGNFLMCDPDRIAIYGTWGTDIPYTSAVLDKAMTDSYEKRKCVVIYGFLQPSLRQAIYVNNQAGLYLRQTPGGIILREDDGVTLLTMPNASPLWLIEQNVTQKGGWTWDKVQFQERFGYCVHELISMGLTPPQPVINWVKEDGVNVRASASTVANILGKLNKGDTITLTGVSLVNGKQANGQPRTWLQIVWRTGLAYIAQEFTQTVPFPKPVPQPIPLPVARNFVGWFLFPDNPDLFLDMLKRLSDVGHPIPVVTVLQDHALADTVKTISPKTVVIFRYEMGNPGPNDSAQAWFDRLWPFLSQCKLADYYEFLNEWLSSGAHFIQFFNDLMDICATHGIHMTVADLSEGVGDITDMTLLMSRIDREHHVLNYHAYSEPSAAGDASMYPDVQDLELRWLPWVQAYPTLQVIFGEAGTGNANYLGVDQTIKLMGEFNAIMAPYAAHIKGGGAWWCAGGRGAFHWDRSTANAVFPMYEKMVMGQ